MVWRVIPQSKEVGELWESGSEIAGIRHQIVDGTRGEALPIDRIFTQAGMVQGFVDQDERSPFVGDLGKLPAEKRGRCTHRGVGPRVSAAPAFVRLIGGVVHRRVEHLEAVSVQVRKQSPTVGDLVQSLFGDAE